MVLLGKPGFSSRRFRPSGRRTRRSGCSPLLALGTQQPRPNTMEDPSDDDGHR
jgi:hypothetical protein